MPYTAPEMNLVETFFAARDAAANQRQLEEARKIEIERSRLQKERESLEPEALASYQQRGDGGLLQTVNPRLFSELEQAKAQKQSLVAQAQAARAAALAKRSANVRRFGAQVMRSDPTRAPQVMAMLQREGAADGLDGINDPAQLLTALEGSAAAELGVQEAQRPLELEREIQLAGFDPKTPQGQAYARRLLEGKAKSGQTNIVIGRDGERGIGLTTAQQSSQQGKVLDADRRLAQLDSIESDVSAAGGYDAIGSYVDSLKSGATQVMSRAGLADEDEEAALARRATAIASIGGFTNEIISELSGANVPDSEMKRIAQSLPLDSDPAPVMKAKIQAWRRNLSLVKERGVDALVNGIRTGQIKLPQSAAKSSQGSGDALGTLNAYGAEFLRQGMTPEQAKAAAIERYQREKGGR